MLVFTENYRTLPNVQIHLTHPLKQRRAMMLDVIDVDHSGGSRRWSLRQKAAQFVLPVSQPFSA
jgi:hypothetical protein